MKSCPKCKEAFERETDVCYYCGFSESGEETVYSTPAASKSTAPTLPARENVHSLQAARVRKKWRTARRRVPKMQYPASTWVIVALSCVVVALVAHKVLTPRNYAPFRGKTQYQCYRDRYGKLGISSAALDAIMSKNPALVSDMTRGNADPGPGAPQADVKLAKGMRQALLTCGPVARK